MKTIKSQMLIYLVTFFIGIFVVFGFFLVRQLNTLPRYIESQHQEIATSKSNEISQELQGYLNSVAMIASSSIMRSGDLDEIREFLPTVVLEEQFRNMTYSDIEGNAWTTVGMEIDISDQDQFQKIIIDGQDYHISNPFDSPFVPEGTPIITVSHSLRDEDSEVIGLVNAVISTDFLNEIIDDVQYLDTGYGFIFNSEGFIVAHPQRESSIENHLSDWFGENVIDVDTQNGTITYLDDNDKERLLVFQNIGVNEEWFFALSIDYEEAFAVYDNTLAFYQFSALSLLAAILIFSLFYASSIASPISKLIHTFEKATEGNLDTYAYENEKTEIGRAGISFNKMIRQIKELTYRDTITGLYNLNSFILELNNKLKTFDYTASKCAVLIISIDDFKRINTISGYEIGNLVLKTFSKNALNAIDEGDLIGRYYGDELIVFLTAVSDDALKKKIESLKTLYTKPLNVNNLTYQIGVSIGVRPIQQVMDLDMIIHQATIAKLEAKEQFGNVISYYNQSMENALTQQKQMEEALLHALRNNEFYLVYQPIMKNTLNNLVGFEVLLRWDHPDYGDVSIERCIKLLEKNGLIGEVGQWIIQTATTQLSLWQNHYPEKLFISVNFSALQLDDERIVSVAKEAIKQNKLSIDQFVFEITESYIIDIYGEKKKILDKIHQEGFPIAIDDFGTGYSSLSYLVNLPIDSLKIDRKFVDNMNAAQKHNIMIETITYLAKRMNIKVIAEGIEKIEQFDMLKTLSCEYFQGFYIDKPLKVDAIDTKYINKKQVKQ